MRRHDRINSWDVVDRSAPHVIGAFLQDGPRDVLYELARSPRWFERRTAIVATGYFIKRGALEDAYRIAEILLRDEDDLVQKATGWMLREAGRKDRDRLVRFLDRHAPAMPRTMLRYATEHLEKAERERYRAMKD
jgi:3-methyladenine DNA glycosylase AlkD